MVGHQPAQRFRGQQRDVARQQYDRAPGLAQRRFSSQKRMPGAELRLLDDEREAMLGRQARFDRIGLVANDHSDGCRRERPGNLENARDHRHACHTVQHLGQRGLDARTFPRGENDDMDVGHRPANYRLTEGAGAERPPAVGARGCGRVERGSKGIVSAQRFEVRIGFRQRAIFRV
jgi:hypothetical protein